MTRRSARLIALALLCLVGAVHYGVDPLAQTYPETQAARRALFYIAQGVKGIVLFGLIATIAPRKLTSAPLYLACLWGAFEDFLVSGCRLAKGIATPLDIGAWRGICSSSNDAQLYWIGPVICAIAAGALLWEFDDASRDKNR